MRENVLSGHKIMEQLQHFIGREKERRCEGGVGSGLDVIKIRMFWKFFIVLVILFDKYVVKSVSKH